MACIRNWYWGIIYCWVGGLTGMFKVGQSAKTNSFRKQVTNATRISLKMARRQTMIAQ